MLFFSKSDKNIHGSASFMRFWERRKFLSKRNSGLVIDGVKKISKELSYTHLATIAPTGAGKTVSYIIPNILSLNGSAVVTDPSGEIFNITAEYKRKQGFKIKKIDVRDVKNSLKINPLFRLNSHTDIKKISSVTDGDLCKEALDILMKEIKGQ